MDTSLAPAISIGNLVLEVDEEYLAVIQAADAELDGTDRLPPTRFPISERLAAAVSAS